MSSRGGLGRGLLPLLVISAASPNLIFPDPQTKTNFTPPKFIIPPEVKKSLGESWDGSGNPYDQTSKPWNPNVNPNHRAPDIPEEMWNLYGELITSWPLIPPEIFHSFIYHFGEGLDPEQYRPWGGFNKENQETFLIPITDHNRGPLQVQYTDIGETKRTIDGTLRPTIINTKRTFSFSWTDCPRDSFATVDNWLAVEWAEYLYRYRNLIPEMWIHLYHGDYTDPRHQYGFTTGNEMLASEEKVTGSITFGVPTQSIRVFLKSFDYTISKRQVSTSALSAGELANRTVKTDLVNFQLSFEEI